MKFPTMWYVGPAKPQISLPLIRAFASRLNIILTEHHLEFLSLKGGCRGSSKSTLVKMSNCWKYPCRGSIVSMFFYYSELNHCINISASTAKFPTSTTINSATRNTTATTAYSTTDQYTISPTTTTVWDTGKAKMNQCQLFCKFHCTHVKDNKKVC